jgi:hypothetical protein
MSPFEGSVRPELARAPVAEFVSEPAGKFGIFGLNAPD